MSGRLCKYGGLIDATLKVYKRNKKRFMRSDDRDNK